MNSDEFTINEPLRETDTGFEGTAAARREGKVLLAVRDDFKRASLSRLLHRRGYQFVVGNGAPGLVAHLRSGAVDLVVCEARDAADPEFDLFALVRGTMPGTPVVVLALGEGEMNRHQLDRAVALGSAVGRGSDSCNSLGCLTVREREVLERIVAGRANKMIAYELSISPRTVENHRARVMEKLRAKTVADLVRIALTAGCGTPSALAALDGGHANGARAMAAR